MSIICMHIITIILFNHSETIKPIQLWVTAKISNVNRIQRFQSKTLQAITKATFYVSNLSIQNDLAISTIHDAAKAYYKRFKLNVQNHRNPLIKGPASTNIPGNPKKG